MRIAFHFPRLASGGVEKMRIVLATELLSRGIQVDFVLCQASGEYLDQVPAGVRVIDLKASRTLNSVFPLVRYLNRERPDRLVSSLGPQNIVAIVASRLSRAKTPVYVTQHNALSRQASNETMAQRVVPILYRWLLPRADGVIAVSRGIAIDMAARCAVPLERIQVVYNPAYSGVSTETGEPSLPEGVTRYVLAIGRLVEQKAYPDLLAAFATVAREDAGLDLLVLGNGPLLADLEELARELGIERRVHFLGFVKNPAAYLAGCSVFVLSSRYEGFGNVIVEALSVGAKVVSTRCDFGPDEILADGKYGVLVPVGDQSALAVAMRDALDSDVDRASLIARAKEFSPGTVTANYLRVLGCGQ